MCGCMQRKFLSAVTIIEFYFFARFWGYYWMDFILIIYLLDFIFVSFYLFDVYFVTLFKDDYWLHFILLPDFEVIIAWIIFWHLSEMIIDWILFL